jgi:hypothetical protein
MWRMRRSDPGHVLSQKITQARMAGAGIGFPGIVHLRETRPAVVILDADDVVIAAGLNLDQFQRNLAGVLQPGLCRSVHKLIHFRARS